MKRFAFYLVFVPVAVVVLLFALANRQWVTLSLDPFNRELPAMSFDAPLFLMLFAVLAIGVPVGGVATWFNQGRHRRAARHARAEAERYKAEAERLRSQLAGTSASQQPVLPAPIPF